MSEWSCSIVAPRQETREALAIRRDLQLRNLNPRTDRVTVAGGVQASLQAVVQGALRPQLLGPDASLATILAPHGRVRCVGGCEQENSGKARRHGVSIQIVTATDSAGDLIPHSPAVPGTRLKIPVVNSYRPIIWHSGRRRQLPRRQDAGLAFKAMNG
ncbi:hypothetical protein ACFWN5_44630 [Streptomyces sp. NPDC058430]|uniref:hypothetical protein n=1 Tax=Streptomyces sp. NPDC058430 TaxID=3346495 RepID=UPI00364DFA7F